MRARSTPIGAGCGVLLLAGVLAAPLTLPVPAARAVPASSAAQVPTAGSKARPARAASADDPINRVVAISVDGLNPDVIRRLGPRGAPALHRLLREGASTLNARTAYEQTITLPNHTGMLTGRRIDRRTGGHGVTVNHDSGSTVHAAAGGYVASVFDVVHDRGGRTALYASKAKFALYARTWNTRGAPDRVGRDNGRAKIDRVTLDPDNARLIGRVTAELRTAPRTFTFVHLSLPDDAGHAHGFLSARYLTAVGQADRLLGQVMSTVSSRPGLRQHTLLVVTSDHGGLGTSHRLPSAPANYRVPFLVWGPGVAGGQNLHALNPDYDSPGTRRPSYAGRQPVRNGDLANLVCDVLDLPAVPGSQFNRRQSLTVFAP